MRATQPNRSAWQALIDELSSVGIDTANLDMSKVDEFQRLPLIKGKKSKLDGSVIIHGFDPLVVSYWNYKTGIEGKFVGEMREKRGYKPPKRKPKQYERGKAESLWKWGEGTEPDDNPYLKAKRVKNYGLREYDGALLIPLRDENGTLHNVQRIFPNGAKRYLKDCKKQGCFFQIGVNSDRFVFVEGYATGATIYEATGLTTIVCFDCYNLASVAGNLRKLYPRERFIFAADTDRHTEGNPGYTKAMEAATKHGDVVIAPPFRDEDKGSDWNDFELIYGLEGVEQISMTAHDRVPMAEPKEVEAPYYRIRDIDDSDLLKPNYLVKSLIPKGSLACVWGEPGAGKTFWAIAANIAVAASDVDTFHSARVRHSNALYCALEGGAGIKKRLRPYQDNYKNCGLYIYDGDLDFRTSRDDADRVIAMANRIGDVGLITIDTMNRALAGGNENSSDDMGAFIGNCQYLIRETGATVLVVHHPGKDNTKGMRGHSSWLGAVDTSIEVKDYNGARKVSVRKQKDGIAGTEFGFQLDPLVIGTDADGDEVSTCTVRTIEPPAARCGRISDRQSIVLDCVYEAIKKHGERPPPDLADNNHGVLKCVSTGTLRDLSYARTYQDIEADSRRKAYQRDITKLSRLGRIKVWKDYVFIPAGQAGHTGTKH